MSVGALNSNGIGPYKFQYPEIKPDKATSIVADLNATETEETAAAAGAETVVEAVESDESEGSESGVIRNLVDGHFRGVADVRLRINFADEIAALEAEKAAEITAAGISGITGMITSESETFLQTEGLDEGLSAVISDGLLAFNSVNTEAVSSSSVETALTAGDSITQLQTAFDAYIESIRNALAESLETAPDESTEIPSADELNSEEVVGVSGTDTTEETVPVTDWQLEVEKFIADLTLSFETALNELNTELENLTVLPELSQPNGNGGAYDKFLAIYNEMQNSDAGISETNSIDVTL